MRDPNRIDPFLQEIGTIWKEKCPNWRFGQLMFNAQRVMQSHGTDIFYMEDDELLKYFREWFDDGKQDENEKIINRMLDRVIEREEMKEILETKRTKRLGERGHVYSRKELSRRKKEN